MQLGFDAFACSQTRPHNTWSPSSAFRIAFSQRTLRLNIVGQHDPTQSASAYLRVRTTALLTLVDVSRKSRSIRCLAVSRDSQADTKTEHYTLNLPVQYRTICSSVFSYPFLIPMWEIEWSATYSTIWIWCLLTAPYAYQALYSHLSVVDLVRLRQQLSFFLTSHAWMWIPILKYTTQASVGKRWSMIV